MSTKITFINERNSEGDILESMGNMEQDEQEDELRQIVIDKSCQAELEEGEIMTTPRRHSIIFNRDSLKLRDDPDRRLRKKRGCLDLASFTGLYYADLMAVYSLPYYMASKIAKQKLLRKVHLHWEDEYDMVRNIKDRQALLHRNARGNFLR